MGNGYYVETPMHAEQCTAVIVDEILEKVCKEYSVEKEIRNILKHRRANARYCRICDNKNYDALAYCLHCRNGSLFCHSRNNEYWV